MARPGGMTASASPVGCTTAVLYEEMHRKKVHGRIHREPVCHSHQSLELVMASASIRGEYHAVRRRVADEGANLRNTIRLVHIFIMIIIIIIDLPGAPRSSEAP